MTFVTAPPCCANHPELPAEGRCARCREHFCDPCCAFLVDDRPWCEPCGNALVDDGRGSKVLAVVVLAGGLALFAGVVALQLFVIHRFYFYSPVLVLFPPWIAYRIAYPPATGNAPKVLDRRRERLLLPPLG